MYTKTTGSGTSNKRLVWLHGWGVTHSSLINVSDFFTDDENILVDFPGFGNSESPREVWDTEDYTKHLDETLQKILSNQSKKNAPKDTYLIGHSFGTRVAIKYAHLYSNKIAGIILIAASGLRRRRSIYFKCKSAMLKLLGKTASKIDSVFHTSLKEKYSNHFGSPDYRKAQGNLRKSMVRIVNEDFSDIATEIDTKTLLLYGLLDTETPPEFGKRYHALIKNSQYIELPDHDHYSILTSGRHLIQDKIYDFIYYK